jgi:NTP pyrophosphatase (non-canonical NTP hydrolase)
MEMGDVFNYLFQLAGMLDIDLDDMWKKQMKKAAGKTYSTGPIKS